MQKKYFNFQPKGMNTNMSPKFQSNEYATYMNNIRITKDDNGILSLQFERGNKQLVLNIKGCVIGTCVLNKYLVLFTQETKIFRRPTGEVVITKTDHIYRLEIIDEDSNITDIFTGNLTEEVVITKIDYIYIEIIVEDLNVTEIFTGNLNFDTNFPLETLGVYENENIQKVYFIDGKNQARVINILENYNLKYNNVLDDYKNTALDFIAELQLNETVTINKIIGTGEFPQGTIQYVFSYYNKHGRQSNLFAQSDLQYLAYNKGVSPEEKVNCSFKIYIDNIDRQFDYLRIYSIIRTSQDAVPTCKRVVDLEITSNNITYIDNGTTGDIIDNTELLYLGGNTICPNTFEQKDGTLFIGNYEIKNNDIPKEAVGRIQLLLEDEVVFVFNDANSVEYKGRSDYYNYEGQLSSSDVAGFKYMEWYGVAIQFQNKNGKFSSPIYLGSSRNYFTPQVIDFSYDNKSIINRGELNLNINIESLSDIIDTSLWVKARLLIVNPTNNLRTIICQGIISSTVFNYRDRYNNSPFTMASWRMNPLGKHLTPLWSNNSTKGEIQNIENISSPLINTSKLPNYNIVIYYGKKEDFYYILITDSSDITKFYSTSTTPANVKETIINWDNNIDVSSIPDDASKWNTNPTIIRQTIKDTNPSTYIDRYGEDFAYDESIVTFNSPDIEEQHNNINNSNKLRIIGILNSNNLVSNYLIQGTDLNDPTKGVITTKKLYGIKSNLLWRDMDSSWDNLSSYDANKDWLFATYLWHRETSYSDNGIEKQGSGSTKKVWSKPLKKIISNTRTCTVDYIRNVMQYKNNVKEYNKFNYYELPIDDIKTITTNNNAIYKLNSNMDNNYSDSISYSADVNKLFPSINAYNIYGNKYNSFLSTTNENFAYDIVKVDNNNVTSQDPIRIKFKETSHAVISFGYKSGEGSIKLPKVSTALTDGYDAITDLNNFKAFWKEEGNFYTNDYIWSNYVTEHINDMSTGNIAEDYGFYNLNLDNDYFYLADLCVQNPDTSPYELSNGNTDIISQYSFIPAGEAVKLTGNNVTLRGNHGDTYYQRWDCLKTFPYSTDDKNQYIDITSFFVESRINLDGRYDKQRGLKYNLGVLDTNFNLINKSYTQRNNFFSYRQIEDEGVVNFPNQIIISKTKILGEDVDSWTNITLASAFDLDGDKGKLNAIRKINNDLYCFQDSGISRLLYNSRVQVNTSDGVPIEIANSAKLQDKQYLSDSIGCQNKWAIKSTPQGIYFVDTYNGELYKINDKGITPISQNKLKNYFTKLSSNIWSPSLWNYNTVEDFVDSIKLEYDSTTSDLYIISKDTALAYNELLGEFTSFYNYGSTLYWVNLNNKSLQINKDGIYEAYRGEYGIFYGFYTNAIIEFIANSEFDLDKIFETVELTTSDTAKINNWKADYYPFDTLEVSNEYQIGKNEASSTTVKKKFRTWRWQIPRNSKKNEDGIVINRDRIRNMWAKIKLSKNYNSPLSIYDINIAYYS